LDLSSVHPNASEQERPASLLPGLERSRGFQPPPKDTFYFYQSSDGQAIFLHALNVQMLVHEHGGLDKCPKVIKGRILEKDQAAMTEELRNKLRYLRHLPVSSNFEVCELDLAVPPISAATLEVFSAQLEQRRRKRARRAKEEQRREKKIQLEQNKMMGKFPGKNVRIESEFHFPHVGSSPALLSAPMRRSTESLDSAGFSPSRNESVALAADPLVVQGTEVAPLQDTASFANMVRKAPTAVDRAKPVSGAVASPPSFSAPAIVNRHAGEDSENEEDNFARPPPQASLGDVLASAMESAAACNTGSKKKGKKSKAKMTISLGAPRPSM